MEVGRPGGKGLLYLKCKIRNVFCQLGDELDISANLSRSAGEGNTPGIGEDDQPNRGSHREVVDKDEDDCAGSALPLTRFTLPGSAISPAHNLLPSTWNHLCQPANCSEHQADVEVEDGQGRVLAAPLPVQKEGGNCQQGADEADGDSSTNSSMHSVILFIGKDWGGTGQAAVFNSGEES